MSENVVVQVDIESVLKRIDEKFESLKAELLGKRSEGGKGEVLPAQNNDKYRKILEAIKGGIKEQWETPLSIPAAPVANLISFVTISREIEGGKPGDVVNIPVVRDTTASPPSGGNLVEVASTDLYGVIQTTLTERGLYADIPYGDIERLTEDLLAEIEAAFNRAILRSIDAAIISAVSSASGVTVVSKGSASVNFDADWIAEAITSTGRDVRPQDYVLVLTPSQYLALYQDIVSSLALTFARPDVVRDGMVQEFLGVKILVLPKALMPNWGSSPARKCAVMIHKRAVVFAPKRSMLLETDRLPKERRVRLAGSYTFGIAVVDPAACVIIQTPETA